MKWIKFHSFDKMDSKTLFKTCVTFLNFITSMRYVLSVIRGFACNRGKSFWIQNKCFLSLRTLKHYFVYLWIQLYWIWMNIFVWYRSANGKIILIPMHLSMSIHINTRFPEAIKLISIVIKQTCKNDNQFHLLGKLLRHNFIRVIIARK